MAAFGKTIRAPGRTEAQIRDACRQADCEIVSLRWIDSPNGKILKVHWRAKDGWGAARLLEAMAKQDAEDPRIIALAEELATEANHDPDELGRLIHDFVFRNVRFRREDVETFQGAWHTLTVEKAGDCDDHALLTRALAIAAALFASRFEFLRKSGQPAHVFSAFGYQGAWHPCETTLAAVYGEPPMEAARRLGIKTRPDLEGQPVTIGGISLEIATVGYVVGSSSLPPGSWTLGSKASRWQDDPQNTQWAAQLFQTADPSLSDAEIQAALAVSALETGIGRLGKNKNNFGALMAKQTGILATSPPPAACGRTVFQGMSVDTFLGTDLNSKGQRVWVCWYAFDTPLDGAKAFLSVLKNAAGSTLGSGDANTIAKEMRAHKYYGFGPEDVAPYAAMIEGCASIVSKHLGQPLLVIRRTPILAIGLAILTAIGLGVAGVAVYRRSGVPEEVEAA